MIEYPKYRGLDLAVRNMKLGDRWALKIPSNLAFGDKGVKPSPGNFFPPIFLFSFWFFLAARKFSKKVCLTESPLLREYFFCFVGQFFLLAFWLVTTDPPLNLFLTSFLTFSCTFSLFSNPYVLQASRVFQGAPRSITRFFSRHTLELRTIFLRSMAKAISDVSTWSL
jgi:hypothetical protein